MARNNVPNEANDFDIAIIGMAGRFPGAKNIEKLWRNLCEGVESVTFFTDEELLEAGVDSVLLKDPNYVKAAALLDDPELFDAPFFGYSPRETTMMDPQHRLFLECAWEVLEQAGYDTDRYDGPIAVYGGASMNTYFLSGNKASDYFTDQLSTLISSDKDFLATRVSYKLNLKGPSITIGTGCSTSLVAVHLACQSLLNHECDMALAGGATIKVPQKEGYLYQRGGIESPDGHCRAFDARAQGTIFGSGVGVVLLKRLTDALADGDTIHAVIKGSAINNDGNAKVGYTAPSVGGQSRVILQALTNSGVDADTISYIEAHGTGTALGDPIEVAALTRAFRNYTDKKGFCAIGSVKTNIGHLDVAAGITALIKTVMALKHKKIPPTLHFNRANPEIDFPNSPFYVNTTSLDWKARDMPLRAGVSSFGVGGTNAHVILEETPAIKASGESRPWQLLVLSAKTESALETATKNLVKHLDTHPDINLADAAFTLQTGRKAFNHRRRLVCRDINDTIAALRAPDEKRVLSSSHDGTQRDVVFIFSGQGSQYVNMGVDLYKTEPVFRDETDRCFKILRTYLDIDLHDIMYPPGPVTEEVSERLTQTVFTQAALFTIEYALAKLWMSWGIKPAAMVGHSIGEYVAACLAGVFSLEDALKLVAARGRLMQEMPGGSMLAVFLSEKELQPLLNEHLSVAVINLPSLCVVSGNREAIAGLEKQLSERKVLSRKVRTSHAFHSKMMDPVVHTFAEEVKKVDLHEPQIPFLSNKSGTWITPEQATNPEHWGRHLRDTVRYSECISELLKENNRIFLEVGPGNTFSALVRQHPETKKEHLILSSTRHPKDQTQDIVCILNTLGQLWMAGVEVDWEGFYANEKRHHVPLPTYPFERQRYWIDVDRQTRKAGSSEVCPPSEDKEAIRTEPKAADKQPAGVDEGSKDVEQTLATLWQNILGVKQVSYDDNFFDLGGNSLIAVQLFTRIEKIFNKKYPIAILYKASTIRELAEIIRTDKETAAWKCLVEMKPGNSRLPLYLVHAGGGNVLIFHNLVRYLKPEQAVYGLQSQGLDRERPFHTSVKDMAAQYLREIQAIQPTGPYLLGGFCMGGTIALEMAHQLQTQGQEVPLVIFMETYNWSNMPPMSFFEKLYYYLQKIDFNRGRLFSGEIGFMKRRIDIIKEKIAVTMETMKSSNKFESSRNNGFHSLLYELEKTNDRAALEYIPDTVYPGRIVHFVPAKEYKSNAVPEANWDKFVKGGIELYKLPVYPRQMLTEPFVPLLAEKINECLQSVPGGTGGEVNMPEGQVQHQD